jgi:hypothetical protein
MIHSLFTKYLLHSSNIGSVIPVMLAAVSVAMVTIQLLIGTAAVSESLWVETLWTDALAVLVPTFHACASHGTEQSLAFTVIIFLCSFIIFFFMITGVNNLLQAGILLSTKVLSAIFTMAIAYTTGHTIWALPLVLFIPLAISSFQVFFNSSYSRQESSQEPAQETRAQQPAQETRAQQPVQEMPTQQPAAPVQTPPDVAQRRFIPSQHVIYHPQNRLRPPTVNPDAHQAPFNSQVITSLISTSRVAQDALLFKNTHPFVARNKKTS